jgi:Zn-dependent protease
MPASADELLEPPVVRRAAEEQTRRLRRSHWSWQVGVVGGIPIRVHLTLAFLLLWVALSYSVRGFGPTASFLGIILVAVVFAIIAVHELGHALVAQRYGVHTREIMLLPIGGIASLERVPEHPTHELAIVLVGPAINLAIAAVLWLGITIAGGDLDVTRATSLGDLFAARLMWINVALALFNLIPAFPMDGGRALRALLATRLGRTRATAIATGVGRTFAIAFAIGGLLWNPWLALIAVVIWSSARYENEMLRLRIAISDVPVSAAMNRQVDTVTPDEPLAEAARLLIATGQNQLPIVEEGSPVGVLTRGDVAAGITLAGSHGKVAEAPRHEAIAVAPSDPLDQVFDQLVSSPDAVAVVVERGLPVGIVTAEQLATFVALRARPDAAR